MTRMTDIDRSAIITGNLNIIAADVDQPASAIEFTITNANGDYLSDVEITDVGQIDIYRFRDGTDVAWTQIVTAAALSKSGAGTLYYSYTFPAASWAVGDYVQIHVTSVTVVSRGITHNLPRVTTYTIVGQNEMVQQAIARAVTSPVAGSAYDLVQKASNAGFKGYNVVSKAYTYDGGAGPDDIFTVTGLVSCKVFGYITDGLDSHGDTTSVGTATSADFIIAATAGSSMGTANTIWTDASPAKYENFSSSSEWLIAGENIRVATTTNLTNGAVTFFCFYTPISSGASVAPV